MTDDEMIARFLATKGVTKVAPGVANLSNGHRDWAKRVRGEKVPTEDPTTMRIIHSDGVGREYLTNGLGELIYVDLGFGGK